MSILIKGMEMPTDGMIGVFISSDGNVYDSMDDIIGTIVPVPPHGRLIDADVLIQKLNDEHIPYNSDINFFIMDAPTIIEAEINDELF